MVVGSNLDEDGIRYPPRSDILFIKYSNDKDIPNSVEELKKCIKSLLEMIMFVDAVGKT